MFSKKDRFIAFLFLLPSLILLSIFVYGFIAQNAYYSVTDWGVSDEPEKAPFIEDVEKEYVGLDNYANLMNAYPGELRFRTSVVNTGFFTAFFLFGCLFFGFVLAVMLDQKIVGEAVFRTIFLYPMAISLVVTGTIWRWLFQPSGGVNKLAEHISKTQIFGVEIFPEAWQRGPLEYRWLSSDTQLWQFDWATIPELITYIGVSIITIIAFNQLFQYRFRFLAPIGTLLTIVNLTSYLGILNAVFGIDLPIIHETLPTVLTLMLGAGAYVAFTEQRWLSLVPIALAIFFWGIFEAGAWNEIWLPIDPFEKQFFSKGYYVGFDGIIIASVWQMSGYVMALFLAGIRGIPEELREAARTDGCSEWQVYLYIILPGLRPVALTAIIILGHISLKAFDLIYAMVGPDNRQLTVPGIVLYTEGFRGNEFANGAAIGVIMLMIISVVIIPYLAFNLFSQEEV